MLIASEGQVENFCLRLFYYGNSKSLPYVRRAPAQELFLAGHGKNEEDHHYGDRAPGGISPNAFPIMSNQTLRHLSGEPQ